MREILFKAISKDGSEWIEGDYLKESGISYIRTKRMRQGGIFGGILITCENVKVQPETVCEYTGKKDATGKNIFRNDIVMINDTEIGIVEYRDDIAAFIITNAKRTKCCTFFDVYENKATCTVIGNIFDNPELLEKED